MKKRYNYPDEGTGFLMLKALQFFIENPYTEVYLREFARKTKISLNSCQRFLKMFIKQELIIDYRKGNLRYFKANINSIVFRSLKLVFSLKKMKDSGLIDFLEENFTNVVLFGSISKGKDDADSDIDLVCIGSKRQIGMFEFEKRTGREINAHLFTLAQWKNQKEENRAFYQDVIAGTALVGDMPIVD